MSEHRIVKITADATFSVMEEHGRLTPGEVIGMKNHTYHCKCDETFGAEEAMNHVGYHD